MFLRINKNKCKFLKSVIFIFAVFVLAIQPAAQVMADTYDQQIEALQQQINGYQDESSKLKAQADTLQNAIASLNAQQAALSAQIQQKEVEHQQLVQQIEDTETRIANQKKALGENLRSMYLEADISPLEMIASSKSIGDYIDKQEYRNTIQSTIQKTLSDIKDLKTQLEDKKTEVEQVLEDQKTMKTALTAQEAEKNQLLADTQGQEEAYQNLIGQKNSEIDSLREQQRAANARFINLAAGSGPACGGGYPAAYCERPMDSMVDAWGMYNRECVSYTAWKVASTGRYIPYGLGNANMWPDGARAAGISVDSTPRAGDVAIWNVGYYGHAMYVESVNGNGTINISQYNADWQGTYSTNTISSSGLVYIHF